MTSTLPSLTTLTWLFFMQPITLHYRLKACGIEDPDIPLLKLYLVKDASSPLKRQYMLNMLGVLLLVTPSTSLFTLVLFDVIGYPIDFLKWIIGVIVGITFGITFSIVFGIVVGVAVGVAVGIAGSVAFDLAFSVVGGVAFSIAGGVAYSMVYGIVGSFVGGIALGSAFGIAIGIGIGVIFGTPVYFADGIALGAAGGLAFSVALSVVYGVTFGTAYDTTSSILYGIVGGIGVGVGVGIAASITQDVKLSSQIGIAGGLSFSLFFIIAYYRIPFYLFEVIWQGCCFVLRSIFNQPTLRFAPVLYHDLSYLPHPLLTQHILLEATQAPELVRRILDACAVAPGQRRTGHIVLIRLQTVELEDMVKQRRFLDIIELQGQWLPGVKSASSILLTFRDIARYLQAADTAMTAFHSLQHIKHAEQALAQLKIYLLGDISYTEQTLKTIVPTWEAAIAQLREEIKNISSRELPNPFRAGEPLTPEQGQEVFRGRRHLIEQIESLLVDPSQSVSIALLGPRRCGKTSLLNMLPAMLPDAVCVFFDLQDNPINSATAFFHALAKRAQEQAHRDRRLELPLLPEGDPFEAARQWLESLDHLAGERRILICIDEFERLEDLFRGERRELLTLMGLFRATIQHRRHVRLLISGVAPFDELDSLWSDHFINLREIRIENLAEETVLELLTQPIKDFPEQAITLPIAKTIWARTGGQPYLIQLYGSLLIQYLNEIEEKQADLAYLELVEERLLEQATYYFRNTIQVAPPSAQTVLEALAIDQSIEIDKNTQRWLKRRCLLTDNNKLLIPVLGTWINEYW